MAGETGAWDPKNEISQYYPAGGAQGQLLDWLAQARPLGPTGPASPGGGEGGVEVMGPTGPQGIPGATGSTGTFNRKGSVVGDNAATGDVGEYLAAVNIPGIALTTTATANVTTLILPAGDWLVGGIIIFNPVNTGPNSIISGISKVTQSMPSDSDVLNGTGTVSQVWSGSLTSGKQQTLPTGMCRINANTSTNVYLVAQAAFGGGTVTATGRITARRTR